MKVSPRHDARRSPLLRRQPVLVFTDGRNGVHELVERKAPTDEAPYIHNVDLVHLARNVAAGKDDSKNKLVHMSWMGIYTALAQFAVVRTKHEFDALFADRLEKPNNDQFKKYEQAPRKELQKHMLNKLLTSTMRRLWMSMYVPFRASTSPTRRRRIAQR